jgi:hypothetical protein
MLDSAERVRSVPLFTGSQGRRRLTIAAALNEARHNLLWTKRLKTKVLPALEDVDDRLCRLQSIGQWFSRRELIYRRCRAKGLYRLGAKSKSSPS